MTSFLIFVVAISVLFFGGIFGFQYITTRLAYSWARELDKEWGVRPSTHLQALQEIHYLSLKGSLKPDYRHFKAWFQSVYWDECIKIQPGIPFGMQLKREIAAAVHEEQDRQILYGDGFGGTVTGIFNTEGIESANEMRSRKENDG